MAEKGSTNKKPLKAAIKKSQRGRKKAPKKRGRKPSPPTAKKRLAGIRAYNLVKKKLKIFYAERNVVLERAVLNKYTSSLYEAIKKSSKSYKKGNFKILNKTIDALLKGNRATEEIFSANGLLFPGSELGENIFAFWQLAEELRLYANAKSITIDYSMLEDGSLRDTGTIRKYKSGEIFISEFDALDIMREIAQYLRDNDDTYPEKYLWFERTITGPDEYLFKLFYDAGLTQQTQSGDFNKEGTEKKTKEAEKEAEKEKEGKPPQQPSPELQKIQTTSAIIESNNREIIATIEKKTKSEENKTQIALSIKALKDIGEDVSSEMEDLKNIRSTIELYNAYIIALESENAELKKSMK